MRGSGTSTMCTDSGVGSGSGKSTARIRAVWLPARLSSQSGGAFTGVLALGREGGDCGVSGCLPAGRLQFHLGGERIAYRLNAAYRISSPVNRRS